MSQNVTLPTPISPSQSLAVAALVNGSTVTQAAEKAGVARETVSRWVHRDPAFIAELQNTRAEIAAGTRCALEALGVQAIATLADALRNSYMQPTRLRAACAVLKLLGADRAETMAPTTAREVDLRLRQRAEELRKSERDLDASQAIESRCIDDDTVADGGTVTPDAGEAVEGRCIDVTNDPGARAESPDVGPGEESRCIDATNDPAGALAARASREARRDEGRNSSRTGRSLDVSIKENVENGSGFPVTPGATKSVCGHVFPNVRVNTA